MCARTTAAGLACLHRAHPHLTDDPCAQAGPGAPPRWASRPGEPFAGLPKCFEGVGQKEVSCAGQRAPARAARVVRGGVTRMGLLRVPPPREARSLSYENRCPAQYGLMWCDGHVLGSLGRCAHCAQTQLICGSAVRSACAVKMSAGGNSRITAWRGLMASKGLSGAALLCSPSSL